MATRVPAANALIVGLAAELNRIQQIGRCVDDRHAWTTWAVGFDDGDRTSLAEDIAGYLAEPRVLDLLTRFVTEHHAARLDAAARRNGGAPR